MPDHLETEIKLPLRDPAATRAALVRAGAIPHGRYEEFNIRLDDAERRLTAQGMVLRLRRSELGSETERTLTLKAGGGDASSPIQTRREIEVSIGNIADMLALLAVLGYEPYWRYEKRREVLTWRRVEVALDEMPYGWFLEIEGPEDSIYALVARLGLEPGDGLPYSYAEIFENVRCNLGLDVNDLTFEAFEGVEVPAEAYYPPGG